MMKSERVKRWFAVIVFLCVTALAANAARFGAKKEGYHGDELYTYHFISQTGYPSITAKRGDESYLNHWHDSGYYMDYLVISAEERFDIAGTYHAIAAGDPHPPLFYILIELFCSVFSYGLFTKWSGIAFNLVFFTCTLLLLYQTAMEMTKNRLLSLSAVLIYGVSAGALSTVVFIRMYMMLVFFSLLFFHVHLLIWDRLNDENAVFEPRLCLCLFASAFLGFMTQYYFLIYEFFVCLCMFVYLLVMKRWRMLRSYVVTMFASLGAGALFWPYLFKSIFSGYRGKEAFENLGRSGLADNVRSYLQIISREMSGGYGWLVPVILAALSLLVFIRKQSAGKPADENHARMRALASVQLAMSAAAYVVLIAKISPYQVGRYVYIIYPHLVLLVLSVYQMLSERLCLREWIGAVFSSILFLCSFSSESFVDFLYPGTADMIAAAREYSNLPVVLLTDDNRRFVTAANTVFMTIPEKVFPIDESGIGNIRGAFNDSGSDHSFLLYIDNQYENIEQELQKVMDSTGSSDSRYLYANEVSDVYLIYGD